MGRKAGEDNILGGIGLFMHSSLECGTSNLTKERFVLEKEYDQDELLHGIQNALTAFARGGSTATRSPLTATKETSSAGEIKLGDVDANDRGPLKVLFLSADTGGGHRASAESLAAQFLRHFPGSTYDLLDVWTPCGVYPWKTLVDSYTHMSAHPRQWRFFFHTSNMFLSEKGADWHSNLFCGKGIRKRIIEYDPDVVVCVHPAMTGSPSYQLARLSKKLGKHVPFYTVVTDLGTAHATWFRSKRCDKIYVASDRIKKLAKRRGRFPDNKIVEAGLPIRQAFADEEEKLGDRTSEAGRAYQASVRKELDIDTDRQMVLVMGGGEGVGGLETIVDELYTQFMKDGITASIYVVCGRNEKLKESLASKDWSALLTQERKTRKRDRVARIFKGGKKAEGETPTSADETAKGDVKVVGLGFVTKMAEYMVGADVLVSKAGPGTIAEAACVGLPVMMTSFLPGQEAGNVDVVLENNFGEYNDKPVEISEIVSGWLQNPELLAEMSKNAKSVGRPHAAEEIVIDIGTCANAWKSLDSGAGRMSDL
ncbi:Monogalactosyldiacylglycerol synthase 2, chloroplastic [Seminavis robusta]|uniref:monogalactosyldiacylglycerol synthase n=1 Tax=Seminavis robusta TaxID=568900 RepID=A0A9N8D827_9STRA|nr:Monogalactosyldiacylglycerol synthase 2, chloroplastic [Seminavis robusta]|eukprot:Sro26_g017720.1 Monogalactosyldiacylglycerol synthase 2, chloroplastic (539) ;mRNA; f:107456-109829